LITAIYLTDTAKENAAGSSARSKTLVGRGRIHRSTSSTRRISEQINPLDRAREIQDQYNSRSSQRQLPDRFTDSKNPIERKRQRSPQQQQHQQELQRKDKDEQLLKSSATSAYEQRNDYKDKDPQKYLRKNKYIYIHIISYNTFI
jgi:hypothetical protein